MSTTNKILEKIKAEKLSPAPKWQFTLRRLGLWLLIILAIILGGATFSTVIFTIANQDWDIGNKIGAGPTQLFLLIFPYFWLIILIALLLCTYFEFRHTRRGYKYHLAIIAILYIITTGILGGIFYSRGWAAQWENAAAGKLPYYNQLVYARALWTRADAGLLAGKILTVNGDNLQLLDMAGHTWHINIGSSTGRELLNEEKDVKIIGRQIGELNFTAEQIRPWCGCSGCMKHQGQSCLDHCRAQTQ